MMRSYEPSRGDIWKDTPLEPVLVAPVAVGSLRFTAKGVISLKYKADIKIGVGCFYSKVFRAISGFEEPFRFYYDAISDKEGWGLFTFSDVVELFNFV